MDLPPFRTLIPLFEELRGERVLIRPYNEGDAPALHAAIDESRDELRPWLPFADAHRSLDETRDFILRAFADYVLRQDMHLGLWDHTTDRLIGAIGFRPRDWSIGYFAIGYWLRTSATRRGYVTEAVRLLTDFAFDTLGAQRVEICCDVRNWRSAAVAERLGFVREGQLRNHQRAADGSLRTTLVYALTTSDPRWLEPEQEE
jgi:RimJ/RimL family protein N-acetyltransferase